MYFYKSHAYYFKGALFMIGDKLLRPDMDKTRKKWADFWAGKNDKPMIWLNGIKKGKGDEAFKLAMPYPQKPENAYETYAKNVLRQYEECFEIIGDEVPVFVPNFGPDQLCGFWGQEIGYSDDSSGTSWSIKFDKELEELLPIIKFDPNNHMYKEMIKFHKIAAEIFDEKIIINTLDYHSNWDAICSLRDPMYASMDIIMYPDIVKQALEQVAQAYHIYFKNMYDAGNMANTGTSCWVPVFCEKKYTTINCDFICLLGPEQGKEFALDYVRKECESVDHAIYHLDGYDAVKHLPEILSIPKIRAINWVPGSGAESDTTTYWMSLYEQILSTGTGVQIFTSAKDALEIHKALKSPNMIYSLWGADADEMKIFYDQMMSI